MGARSRTPLRILHAVRLLGFSDVPRIAARSETSIAEVRLLLRDFETNGWIRKTSFADLSGWSLTESGRIENERQLAHEREIADPDGIIEAVHQDFMPLNARLFRACTDWQVRPTVEDKYSPNDHEDPSWDERVLDELAALSRELEPLNDRLTSVLDRFSGYAPRFAKALEFARRGDRGWVAASSCDSCHLVWFQLHEDLIATLGISREDEPGRGDQVS
ncbi:hypothetical protein ACFORJ_01490 [Corynebacterium hansenii]|uniref:Transcriptional regulator n=1 Tax=Corynebacterium hansenii TaxID=394964 RepID=A0ABV7ZNJ6_9CORY|nr:hypothetical protein [Corynebacterium hansenii]WJY99327.1 hypothetical protein CHAN_03500 [Corynebacterium hansenii]